MNCFPIADLQTDEAGQLSSLYQIGDVQSLPHEGNGGEIIRSAQRGTRGDHQGQQKGRQEKESLRKQRRKTKRRGGGLCYLGDRVSSQNVPLNLLDTCSR